MGHIGAICDAKCTSDADCPTDTPGGTAQPGCILQDSDTGDQACGLECGILGGSCPDGASCSSPWLVCATGLVPRPTARSSQSRRISLSECNTTRMFRTCNLSNFG